jgi:hypothetical protein
MKDLEKDKPKPVFNKEKGGYDYVVKTGRDPQIFQKLHIREGITKDLMEAQRESEGDSSRVPLILISKLCTLDGAQMVVEDWERLPLKVGTEVLAAFSEVNF